MIKLILFILLNVTGVTLIKLNNVNTLISISTNTGQFSLSLTSSIGIICYIMSFLLWLSIIRINKLSFIFPLATGIVTIIIFLIGVAVFNEALTGWKVAGLLAITIGVLLINTK